MGADLHPIWAVLNAIQPRRPEVAQLALLLEAELVELDRDRQSHRLP